MINDMELITDLNKKEEIMREFGDGYEFYKSLTKSHPNLASQMIINARIHDMLYGIDIGAIIFKNNLLMLFLLFKSNDNEIDAFNNMVNNVDGFSDLLDSLGKLK